MQKQEIVPSIGVLINSGSDELNNSRNKKNMQKAIRQSWNRLLDRIYNTENRDEKLLIAVKKLLLVDLLKNHFLSLNTINTNGAWINRIVNQLDDGVDKDQLVDEYNQIRESSFMERMRENYLDNNSEFTMYSKYAKFKENMCSLAHNEINDWDKFCHFFAHVAKLIYNVLSLGEYKSTKDKKEEHNAFTQSWNEFSKKYETNFKKALGC